LRVLAPLREYVFLKHPPNQDDLKRLVDFYAELAVSEGSTVGRDGGLNAIARITPQMGNIEGAILQGIQSSDPEPALGAAALGLANFSKLTGLGSTKVLEKAASKAKALGDEKTMAHCFKSLGEIWFARSDHDAAAARFEEALPLYRKLGYGRGEANCILGLGTIALARSQHGDARAHFEKALSLYTQVADVLGQANCFFYLGEIGLARSEHNLARERFEEALPLYRQSGFLFGEANCIAALGNIALDRSEHDLVYGSHVSGLGNRSPWTGETLPQPSANPGRNRAALQ
jgi:tetratricopeptide (TPR) repeat protein